MFTYFQIKMYVFKKQTIPFKNTGYFSKIICDYLEKKESVREYYGNFPDIEGFKDQIKLRLNSDVKVDRKSLVEILSDQYAKIDISDKTRENIDLLRMDNTFTITTGHQLNLFTGPLYFLYKIISTINLTEQLKKEFPKYNFVPIYWMATEDHDFEEIQYFNFKGDKYSWKRNSGGAVGRLSTKGLDDVYEVFGKQLGFSKNAKSLKSLFEKSYLQHENLAEATRFLANELFSKQGLVIVDADEPALKKSFIPFIEQELLKNTCFKEVSKTIENLKIDYDIQVNPREINLFYLQDNLRERIVNENGIYKVLNTEFVFTKEEILEEVYQFPEKFSPNVLTRPLYQEIILPNLCYIGGGGELAYWFELKDYFDEVHVPFPILLLRNSVLLVSEKQIKKMHKLDVSVNDIFMNQNQLIQKKVKEISEINIDLSNQKAMLRSMFTALEVLSDKTDKSFLGAVKAQEKKQLNGIENLEKRLLKAQKRKLSEKVSRISNLQNQLFPKNSLQERYLNFSELYIEYGSGLIDVLTEALQPFEMQFDIIEMDDITIA